MPEPFAIRCHLRKIFLVLCVVIPSIGGLGCGREDSISSTPDSRPAQLPAAPAIEGPSAELQAIRDELRFLDPQADGFGSELASHAAEEALKAFGGLMGRSEAAADFQPWIEDRFVGSELRPDNLQLVHEVRGLEFRRGVPVAERHHGAAGFAEALRHLAEPFGGSEILTKFKIVQLEVLSPTEISTGILYLAMGHSEAGTLQQNARWQARWSVAEGREHPELLSLVATDFEENRAPRPVFSEVTRSLFADRGGVDRMSRGIDSWWGRLDAGIGYSFYGDYGMILGDIDNDGLDDIYFCQPGGVPNQLFLHRSDGTLTEISAQSGTDLLNDTPTALFADLDNDGNQDLVAATLLYLMVLRGDGTGGFELATEVIVDNAVSIAAADYDNDGLLDLYVSRYSSTRSTGSGASLYDSNDGRPNVLLRNEGRLGFRDVTVESGIDHNNRKFSFAGVWEDYDNDGDQDLYVANDFGRNNLYRNDGGRFRDVAGEAGAEDSAAGMGASWADYNQDGLMDLYVSNMFSSAGGRIVDKPAIAALAGSDAVQPLARFAKGNTLLENRGDGTFRDVSDAAGVTMGRWSWGGEFVDFDNDSWPDLVVPNGFITNHNSKDL